MSDDVEVLVHLLCEGYHDRSFWKGALGYLGFHEQRKLRGKTIRGEGQFGYKLDNVGVIVKPSEGSSIKEALKSELQYLDFDRLVYNVDCDDSTAEMRWATSPLRVTTVFYLLRRKRNSDHWRGLSGEPRRPEAPSSRSSKHWNESFARL